MTDTFEPKPLDADLLNAPQEEGFDGPQGGIYLCQIEEFEDYTNPDGKYYDPKVARIRVKLSMQRNGKGEPQPYGAFFSVSRSGQNSPKSYWAKFSSAVFPQGWVGKALSDYIGEQVEMTYTPPQGDNKEQFAWAPVGTFLES